MDFLPRFLLFEGGESFVAVQDIRQQILDALEALAPSHDIDIVDVEITGAKATPVVRVRIDHLDEAAPTITLDEVAAQTAWIGDALDALDPLSSSYTLEVSSPGMARPLRRAHDFERFAAENVQVTTTATEGRRRFSGKLLGIDGDEVVIVSDEGEQRIALADIKSAHIKPDYDAGKGKKK